ncbi:MAG: hypothetical protein NT124_05010 [Candidatus Dependentiae bacterium]|nr:hypothetical protein [Candidatus Dependentiae bacterium]
MKKNSSTLFVCMLLVPMPLCGMEITKLPFTISFNVCPTASAINTNHATTSQQQDNEQQLAASQRLINELRQTSEQQQAALQRAVAEQQLLARQQQEARQRQEQQNEQQLAVLQRVIAEQQLAARQRVEAEQQLAARQWQEAVVHEPYVEPSSSWGTIAVPALFFVAGVACVIVAGGNPVPAALVAKAYQARRRLNRRT